MSRGQTSGKYILLHQLQDMSRGQTSGNRVRKLSMVFKLNLAQPSWFKPKITLKVY